MKNKVLKKRYCLFAGLFLVIALSFGLSFINYKEYALNYLPLILLLLALFGTFFLLKHFLKDRQAKPHKWKFLTKMSAKLATKEGRYKFILSCLSILLCLIFFGRFYFFQGTYSYVDKYGSTGSFSYYDILHLESRLLMLGFDPYLLAKYESVIGTLFNDLWVAVVILSLVSAFYLNESAVMAKRYIGAPIAFLITLGFPIVLKGIVGTEAVSYRSILMAFELAIIDFYYFHSFFEEGKYKLNKKDVCKFFAILIPLLLTMASSYSPALLFGKSVSIGGFNLTNPKGPSNLSHRIYLYLAFILPIVYFRLLYPMSKEERRGVLLQISLGTFIGYISINRFDIWKDLSSWPLHLCNTAMYTMPITLMFMSYGLYYFTFFVNVLGAFLALLMPNFSETLYVFDPKIIVFFINHLNAFFMPVLIMLLGIYKRPKFKYFLYSQIGFFVYFAFVMGVNTVLTAHGINSDFFFINSSFVADKLGEWAKRLFRSTIVIEKNGLKYTLHLAYDALYYVVYILLAFAMWFVYELLFRLADELLAIRKAKELSISRHKAYLAIRKGERIMSDSASLRISHLAKRYHGNDFLTVKDFSLDLVGGKIYGFLGKNGAGKSTIIKSIVGIHGFEGGEIDICGHNVIEEPLEAKKEIGFVPDNYALYENLTGRQYIGYIADLYHVSKEQKEEIEQNLVKRLELTDRYDKPMKSYSHGMKQKITIIAALIHKPKVWILDEPMTGLDPNSIYQIKECMREHAKEGNIVFFSSHIIDVVKNLCDEVVIIKKGDLIRRIDLDAEPNERETLEETFLRLTSDNEEEANTLIAEEKKEKGAA